MLDIIIRRGKVVDGSGKIPPRLLDVGINDDLIIKVGDLENEVAKKEIDANGKLVTPGFIDINSHSDTKWTIFRYPSQESLLYQGVTSIVGGNCGSSLAPILGDGSIKSLRKWISLGDVQIDWDRMGEYLDYISDNRPLKINYLTLVGHATLRRGILGDEIRTLDRQEMRLMIDQIDRAMEEGAFGVSLGLAYAHARSTSDEEINLVAKKVAEKRGLLSVHLKGEGSSLLSSVRELIKATQQTGVNLEISHLKVLGKNYWSVFGRVLELVRKAKKRGLNINFDIYPYDFSGPVLYTLLPQSIIETGREELIRKLKSPKIKKELIKEMKKGYLDYSKIVVASSPVSKLLVQRNLEEIAQKRKISPEEAVLDLIVASEDQCKVLARLMSENNVIKGMKDSLSMISSGGAGYSLAEEASGNLVHARSFGSFSRFLGHYVRKKKIMTIAKAIHKISGLPAEKLGLKDRGLIAEGYKADITILDWNKVEDKATMERPYMLSKGTDAVIINGVVTFENGKIKRKIKSGLALRKK